MTEPKRWTPTRYDGVAMAPSTRGRYVNGLDYDDLAADFDRLRDERDRLAEAHRKIERLVAKWGAPIRHDVDDRIAYEQWAAVGSEAHKIAADALAVFDTLTED